MISKGWFHLQIIFVGIGKIPMKVLFVSNQWLQVVEIIIFSRVQSLLRSQPHQKQEQRSVAF